MFVRAQGDREGGAPAVVLTLVLAGVVALDAVSRGVIAVARRLILERWAQASFVNSGNRVC